MSSCTYTAQGFLLCPKQNNVAAERSQPRYSTIGFDRDAEAGVFIEPFEQYQQGAPSNTEKFGVKTNTASIPQWTKEGQFAKECKECKFSGCQGGRENKCDLTCNCTSCTGDKFLSKKNIPTNGMSKPLFFCGGRELSSTECDAKYKSVCEEEKAPKSKSAFIEFQQQHQQRQNFQNSPYDMGQ